MTFCVYKCFDDSVEKTVAFGVLTKTGHVVSRSSVQRVTELEKQKDAFKKMFSEYDEAISKRVGDKKGYKGDKVAIEDWAGFADDPLFVEKFEEVYNNRDIPAADISSGDLLEDTYLHVEISLPREFQSHQATHRY